MLSGHGPRVFAYRIGPGQELVDLAHGPAIDKPAQDIAAIDNSSRFLAVVQAGMMLTAVLAGAVSGATLPGRLGDWLDSFAPLAKYGKAIAIVLAAVPVSYVSLLLGELVPKQIALAHAESIDTNAEPEVVRLDDGSLLIDTTMPIAEVAELLGIRELAQGEFLTFAGFVLFRLDHVPQTGEHFTSGGRRFEVVKVEGRRIDKVLARQIEEEKKNQIAHKPGHDERRSGPKRWEGLENRQRLGLPVRL